jgi:putative glutamine amidotransferase
VKRPRIAVGAYPREVDISTGPTLLHTLSRFYVDAVSRAGGVPVILPVSDPALAADALGGVDGLVLAGGGDVDPSAYGQPAEPEVYGVDEARDAWELALLTVALDRHLPVLAICRGIQVVNVALGGTLVQHIPTATGARHGWPARYNEPVHRVQLDPSCALAGILGVAELDVNSLHHQAVDRTGQGVRAVGWSPDGTVEAVELTAHPEVIAVQWHPELLEHDPHATALFTWLISLAAGATAENPT